MASLSLPPPAGPTSSRLDWGHTGERNSTTRGSNRGRSNAATASRNDRARGGRGGGRRGGASARGGRSHGSSPLEKSINTPTAHPDRIKSAPLIVSTSSQTSNASKKSSSSSPSQPVLGADNSVSKDGAQRVPRHAADNLPSLTIEPASPTAASGPHSASTTSSKMSTRRRRSHNKPSGGTKSSEGLTAEVQASTVQARKSRSGPSSPHAKNIPPKNTPPHLSASPTVTSSSTKSNIDSLVEHVRALAMDHRPSTPGSHIDWADEDDSLPDLDDWAPTSSVASTKPDLGTTANIEKAQSQLMSPILDDTLKQLPQSFDKTSPSPSVVSGSLSPNIANVVPVLLVNGPEDVSGGGVAKASSSIGVDTIEEEERSARLPKPSSRMGPASPPSNSQPFDSSHPPEQAPAIPSKDAPPHIPPTPEPPAPASSITPPIQPGRSLADSIHAPNRDARSPAPPPESRGTEPTDDTSASVSAAAPKCSTCEIDPLEGAHRLAPPPRNPAHGRSHTVGRPSRGFFSGSAAKGPHHGHGRTQSSPVAHRRQQSRPVITMDAMTRLAKTLGTALPKREAAATNSATSSE